MGTPTLGTFLGRLRQAMAAEALADCPDRELVERLRAGPDEAAFRAVLGRHGPMVYAVCRRALPAAADAEDAFQATFLVLARRGHAIRRRAALGSWLHGVARRTALKLRTQADRRRRREARAARPEPAAAPDDAAWGDVRGVLDEDLGKLPASCREALVLCYLEGRTRDEAAARLAVTPRTLHRYLERGRELLGRRLARRGLTLGAALAARLVTDCAYGSGPPRELLRRTLDSATPTTGPAAPVVVPDRVAALTEGVTRAMRYAKYKTVLAVVACGLGLGVGLVQVGPRPVAAQDRGPGPVARPPAPAPEIEPIDPHLVFDPAVQEQLRLSPNQVRRLAEARERGGAAAADHSQRMGEIDQRLKKLQEEMERLNRERHTAALAVQKAEADQVKAAIPAVLSRDAVRQLRELTVQRMRLSDVLLDARVRARLGLNDEQVKRIQELAEKGGAGTAWLHTESVDAGTGVRYPPLHINVLSGFPYPLTDFSFSPIEAQADLLKVLTPQQRQALEQLSGVKIDKAK